MSNHIRLSKGLDIPLKGNASNQITKTISSDILAVKPSDFRTLNPKLLVKEGDANHHFIGIENVFSRLLLNFGSCDFQMYANNFNGTTVEFMVPLNARVFKEVGE